MRHTYLEHIGVDGNIPPFGNIDITSFLWIRKNVMKMKLTTAVSDSIPTTYFFLALNAVGSNTLRFLDLFKHGVVGTSNNSCVSSRFSDDPIAPTIFRSPLNIPEKA